MEFNTPEREPDIEIVTIKKEPGTALKVGVLIALIILLIVGILLPIKLVPNAFDTLGTKISSFFHNNTVALSTDKDEIDSGIPFTLSWAGSHETDGTYILSYECTDGVHIETSVNQPNETIGCNNQYYFSPQENSIVLTPFSTVAASQAVPISLSFLKNGDTNPVKKADITISVMNPSLASLSTSGSGSVTPSTQPVIKPIPSNTPSKAPKPIVQPAPTPSPAPAGTVTSTYHVSNPSGTADLATTILSVGYLNPATNAFVPSYSVAANERAAVRFKVTNIGDKNSGTWSFTAALPSSSHPVYNSYNQQNLGPGDSIVYTLGFDDLISTNGSAVRITIDPSNFIPETSKANNTAVANIPVTNYGGNNGYYGNGADLSISNLTATSNGYNYTYNYNQNFNGQYGNNNLVTVQFTVKNNGSSPTGQWRFQANLPTDSNSQYVSDYQQSLNPGQSTVLSLTFTPSQNNYYQNNVVSITLDPYNQIQEINKNNNFGSVTVR